MKRLPIFTTLIVLLTVIRCGADESVKHIEDGAVIEFAITTAGAPYKFVVRVEGYGIDKIDVYNSVKIKIQSIKFPDYAQEMPCSDCDLLEFEDINFDGYNDLLILVGWGSGGSMYEVWTFNPKKGIFIKTHFDNEFANPTLDKKKKVLMTSSPMGCCAGMRYYYKYRNSKFYVFKEESYSIESKRNVVVVRELIRGKWRSRKKYGDYLE